MAQFPSVPMAVNIFIGLSLFKKFEAIAWPHVLSSYLTNSERLRLGSYIMNLFSGTMVETKWIFSSLIMHTGT